MEPEHPAPPTERKKPASPAESRRQRKYRQRREAIIEAARRVFERKGYEGASIEEIAAEADFAKGSIYYYFENKSSLVQAVFGDEVARIGDRYRKIAASDGNPVERLRMLVREILGFYERNFGLFRVTAAPPPESPGTDAPGTFHLIGNLPQERDWILAIVEEGRKTGAITTEIDAEETVDLLRGLINAEIRRWDRRGRSEPLAPKGDTLIRLLLQGVSPDSDEPS